jgi:hypothetical protein
MRVPNLQLGFPGISLIIVWLLSSPTSWAGVTVSTSVSSANCVTGDYSGTLTEVIYPGLEFFTGDFYHGNATVGGCEYETFYTLSNTADAPTGNTQNSNQMTLEDLTEQIVRGLYKIETTLFGGGYSALGPPGAHPPPCGEFEWYAGAYKSCFPGAPIHSTSNQPAIGTRDSPGGVILTATSSDAFDFFQTAAVAGPEDVPFIVGSSAPGDSLSIYGRNGVLWSQPLSDFTPGTLYFADIPGQAGSAPGAPAFLTYFLNGADASEQASVWFPGSLTLVFNPTSAPEPSTLYLMLIGIAGLALVLIMRRSWG